MQSAKDQSEQYFHWGLSYDFIFLAHTEIASKKPNGRKNDDA
jgi:hypothetical protein